MKKIMCGLVATFGAVASLLADVVGYPTYTLSVSESGSSQNAWTTPSKWVDATGAPETAFSAEHDYVVSNYSSKAATAFVLRSPASQRDSYTFTCHSMTLGSLTSGKGHAMLRVQCRGTGTGITFPNEGLVLPRGYLNAFYGNGSVTHLYGKVTVTSPSTYPSRFMSGAQNDDTTLHVHGALNGDANAYLEILPQGAVGKTNFTCRISNATQFLGTMDVRNAYDGDGKPWGKMWLELGNTTVGGSLIMGADTQLSGIAGETTAGFSVASLTMKSGSALDLTRGGLTVTQSLTIESTPLTVKVAGIAQKDVTVAQLQNLLTFPASSGLTAKDFVLDGDLGGGELVVREEGGVYRIGLQYYPEARLLVSDNASRTKEYDSSMTNAAHWTNSEAWDDPAVMPAGYHYVVRAGTGYGSNLRTSYAGTIDDPQSDLNFPGESLLCANGSRLVVLNPSFFCKNLILDDGEIDPAVNVNSTLSGKITIYEGGGTIYQYNTKTVNVSSEIVGSGPLEIAGASGASSSAPYAKVRVSGLNTNYTGAITVTLPTHVPAPGSKDECNKTTPRFDRNYVHFMISDKRNLGGALAEANPKALTIEQMCRLELAEGCTSLVLDEPTRGIFIKWVGRFLAEEGETLTVASPLAVYGTLWKEGDGRLILANPAPTFGADAVATDPVGEATNHTFRVAGGDVQIAAVDAVNGLDVVFTNGAKRLVVDLLSETDDFATYGIRNVKTDHPFALEGDLTGVELAFESAQAPTEACTRAVFTVKKGQYDATAAIFTRRTKSAAYKGWKITCSRRDNDDGETATMVADIQRTGLLMILR